jgi:hypothetical protein
MKKLWCCWFHDSRYENGVTICNTCDGAWYFSYLGGGGWIFTQDLEFIAYLLDG